jgi:hypothetical protein
MPSLELELETAVYLLEDTASNALNTHISQKLSTGHTQSSVLGLFFFFLLVLLISCYTLTL